LDVLAAEAARRAAAVHRGVADADDQYAFADRLRVAERDALQPVDADVDVLAGFVAAGDLQLLAARRAGADEDRVELRLLVKHRFQAVDRRVVADVHAHAQDHVDLFVEHGARQAKHRHVGAHETARRRALLEHHQLVAERRQIVGHRQRRGPGADQRDALAVARVRLRQAIVDVAAQVGRDALEPANRDRFLVDARASARGLARAIARAPENSRENVRLAIEHVRIGIASLRNQPDVLGHVGVRRTSPLAIDDFMEVAGITNVGWFHRLGSPLPRIHHIGSPFQGGTPTPASAFPRLTTCGTWRLLRCAAWVYRNLGNVGLIMWRRLQASAVIAGLILVFLPARAPAAVGEQAWDQFRGQIVISDVLLAPNFGSDRVMITSLSRMRRSEVQEVDGFWRL